MKLWKHYDSQNFLSNILLTINMVITFKHTPNTQYATQLMHQKVIAATWGYVNANESPHNINIMHAINRLYNICHLGQIEMNTSSQGYIKSSSLVARCTEYLNPILCFGEWFWTCYVIYNYCNGCSSIVKRCQRSISDQKCQHKK